MGRSRNEPNCLLITIDLTIIILLLLSSGESDLIVKLTAVYAAAREAFFRQSPNGRSSILVTITKFRGFIQRFAAENFDRINFHESENSTSLLIKIGFLPSSVPFRSETTKNYSPLFHYLLISCLFAFLFESECFGLGRLFSRTFFGKARCSDTESHCEARAALLSD